MKLTIEFIFSIASSLTHSEIPQHLYPSLYLILLVSFLLIIWFQFPGTMNRYWLFRFHTSSSFFYYHIIQVYFLNYFHKSYYLMNAYLNVNSFFQYLLKYYSEISQKVLFFWSFTFETIIFGEKIAGVTDIIWLRFKSSFTDFSSRISRDFFLPKSRF